MIENQLNFNPTSVLCAILSSFSLTPQLCSISVLDGRCNLDIHPHHITCLMWPVSRGFMENQVGIVDSLLVGRIDGSLAVVEVFDRNSFTRVEMDQCSRQGGTCTLIHIFSFLFFFFVSKKACI